MLLYFFYECVVIELMWWIFFIGGVFIMYLSGEIIFFEMWNFKVFEFVLFNLVVGFCGLVILEKDL